MHEYPTIDTTDEVVVEEGMVIACEPGLYVDGVGGARLENVLHVGTETARELTSQAFRLW